MWSGIECYHGEAKLGEILTCCCGLLVWSWGGGGVGWRWYCNDVMGCFLVIVWWSVATVIETWRGLYSW
jgi:hypothetical protein